MSAKRQTTIKESDGTIAIKGAPRIEIYASVKGYACIRQSSDEHGHDVTVIATPDQLPLLIRALQRLHGQRAQWQDGEESSGEA